MTFPSIRLERLERESTRLLDVLAGRPRMAAAVLIGLALLCYLPGVLALPPVDRTEIVYAQSTRGMLERGDALDATFEGERYAFRPIGIYWLQMGSGAILGKGAWGTIATYRLPSLVSGVLAVLAVWWLLGPLLGQRRAIIAAALFAVSPIVALQAQLAIPEGPLLLAAAVAQLTLLRLYCGPERNREMGLALAFWAAQGCGILINALAVPILSLSTIAALYVFDRRLDWLGRLRPLIGVPLMAAIAAPWLLVRAHFDGVPFSGLTWGELLRALGGGQDMKWKAAPLTFTLALVLGFLPGVLLLVPAVQGLWRNRASAVQRFLFAWLAGYLVYLELIASKPALYTVQAMFPAAAAAAALALDRGRATSKPARYTVQAMFPVVAAAAVLAADRAPPEAAPNGWRLAIPPRMLRLPWWLVLPGTMALFAGGLTFAGVQPTLSIVLGAALVTALFTLAARAASENLAAAWLALSVGGFALFLAFTLGVLLPQLEQGWPATRIADAIAPLRRCVTGPVGVLGFREPSTLFVLGHRSSGADAETIAGWMATGEEAIAVVEDRFQPDVARVLALRGAQPPPRVGCVDAFNVMRGCPLSFSIYVTGPDPLDAGCKVAKRYTCKTPLPQPPADGSPASRCR